MKHTLIILALMLVLPINASIASSLIDHDQIDPYALDDLSDVTITTPADDQFLRYDGSGWVNETVAGMTNYWQRTSTILSPATANDIVVISSNDASNPTLQVDNSDPGNYASYSTALGAGGIGAVGETQGAGGTGLQGIYAAGSGSGYGVEGLTNVAANDSYGGKFDHALLDEYWDSTEQASPPADPDSGKGRWYCGTDGKPHFINDGSTDYDLTADTGSTTLAGLSDVAISSPANNDFLRYNSAGGKWTNQAVTIPADISGASFVTVSAEGGLSAESVLTAGNNITLSPSAGTLTVSTTRAPGITTIASGNLTSTAVSITSIPATYAHLVLQINGASSDTATRQVIVRVDSDNGASYDATAGNYTGYKLTGTTITNFSTAGLASLIDGTTVTAASTSTATVTIFNYQGGPNVHAEATFLAGLTRYQNFADFIGTTSAINAIQIAWNGTGSFDAGTYALYGID